MEVVKHIRHRKLITTIIIVLAVTGVLLALAQDQLTLKIQSQYAVDDPQFAGYSAALLGVHPTGGNTYKVLTNGDQIFPAMLGAVNSAQRRVAMETYIFNKGSVGEQFTNAFEAAARRGVMVSLVVDAMGSDKVPQEWQDRMKAAGVKIGRFGQPKWYSLEELNYRTHRKILVVDGHIGFTGGGGLRGQMVGEAGKKEHPGGNKGGGVRAPARPVGRGVQEKFVGKR